MQQSDHYDSDENFQSDVESCCSTIAEPDDSLGDLDGTDSETSDSERGSLMDFEGSSDLV